MVLRVVLAGELLGRLLAFLVRRLTVLLGPANVLVRTSAFLVVASNLVPRAAVPSVVGVVGGVGVVRLLVGAAAPGSGRASASSPPRMAASSVAVAASGPPASRSVAPPLCTSVVTSERLLVGHVHVAGPATRRTLLVCTRLIGHGSSLSSDAPPMATPRLLCPFSAPRNRRGRRPHVAGSEPSVVVRRPTFRCANPQCCQRWGICYSTLSDSSPKDRQSGSTCESAPYRRSRGPHVVPSHHPSAGHLRSHSRTLDGEHGAALVTPAVIARTSHRTGIEIRETSTLTIANGGTVSSP